MRTVHQAVDLAIQKADKATTDRCNWLWENVLRRELEAACKSGPLDHEAAEILGAVARGWCHDKNKHKVVDPDLAIAIAAEVNALIGGKAPV